MGLGIDIIGQDFGFGGALQTLARAGAGVIDTVQTEQKAGEAKTAAGDKLRDMVNADKAYTNARYRAFVSAEAAKKQPALAAAAAADQKSADAAARNQDKAAAALPDSQKQARIDAAQQAVTDAQSAILVGVSASSALQAGASLAAAMSVDDATSRKLRLQAAQETLSKAKGEPIDGGDKKKKEESPGFFSKPLVGGVRVWHAIVGVVVVVGGVLLLRRKK